VCVCVCIVTQAWSHIAVHTIRNPTNLCLNGLYMATVAIECSYYIVYLRMKDSERGLFYCACMAERGRLDAACALPTRSRGVQKPNRIRAGTMACHRSRSDRPSLAMRADARLVGRRVAVPCHVLEGCPEGCAGSKSEGTITAIESGRCLVVMINVPDDGTWYETWRVRRWLQPDLEPLCAALEGIGRSAVGMTG
jgi:hypothetical protein